MIRATHIELYYGDKGILADVSLSLDQGGIYGLIGESGRGKTTLLKILSGHLDATKGEVFCGESRVVGPSQLLIPGHPNIELVNQDFALDLHQTAEENVRNRILNLQAEDRDEMVLELLELLRLNQVQSQLAKTLSGGEQQRLSLARALAREPEVLMLDEPFVHLDQGLRLEVMHYLKRLNEIRNTTILLVSHDGFELMGFAEKIIYLSDEGKIAHAGNPDEMYYRPVSTQQGRLLGLLNEVKIGGEDVTFRPNEYSFESGGKELEIEFESEVKSGMFSLFYFLTKNGERIALCAMNDISNHRKMYIEPWNSGLG